ATGVTTRATTSLAGAQANGRSFHPALSADGRILAFASRASNLVANDGNGGVEDVFVLDSACGNGQLDSGEDCDDGNTSDCDGCSASCRVETGCGDGITCGAEECDD